jgi:hypothetical protein
LRRSFFIVLLIAFAWPARADEVVFRGNYYRDRNTRVVQPEADVQKEIPTGTVFGAHYLLDAITSASVAAGVLSDKTFTELRHEAGFSVDQKFKNATVGGSYTYSAESDYWAHTAVLHGSVDLNQKNTTLGLAIGYGHDDVDQRVSSGVYNHIGTLDSLYFIAVWTQTLTRKLLMNFSSDTGVIGFGTANNGFQANVYRTAIVGGTPTREKVPFQRIRQAFTLSLFYIVPLGSRLVPHLSFRGSYRLYLDDWGLVSHTPELRVYLPIGPVELRVSGRYYVQSAASFFSETNGLPTYAAGGKDCTTCFTAKDSGYYSADPKLSAMSSTLIDLRFLWHMHVLSRATWLPAHQFFGAGTLELMYGHYFNTRLAYSTFGDANLAAISFAFPL